MMRFIDRKNFMKLNLAISTVIVLALINGTAHAIPQEEQVTTSTGAIFKRTTFKGFETSWIALDGTIWSNSSKDAFDNEDLDALKPPLNFLIQKSNATEACARIGGHLPTRDQFEKLRSYFEQTGNGLAMTDQGSKDFRLIFSIKDIPLGYWSSSLNINSFSRIAAYLTPEGGINDYYGYRYYKFTVICTDR